tara:strand:- start:8547 stop:9200 length:654 start_codon:yes stop_codon:yes gene_type:complete
MTEQSDFFEYKIPTHIEFTLYRKCKLENLVIDNVLKYCKDFAKRDDIMLVRASSFISAIYKSKVLRREFEKKVSLTSDDFTINSVTFLKSIFFSFVNLEWVTLRVSNNKVLHIVDKDDKKMMKFDFEVKGGIVDLPLIFTIEELNRFNKELIKSERISNKYIHRSPYLYISLLDLFYFIDSLKGSESILLGSMLDLFESKFEAKDPILLLKTDYSIL